MKEEPNPTFMARICAQGTAMKIAFIIPPETHSITGPSCADSCCKQHDACCGQDKSAQLLPPTSTTRGT